MSNQSTAVAKKDKGELQWTDKVIAGAGLDPAEWNPEMIATVKKMACPEAATIYEMAAFLKVCDRYALDPIRGEAWLAQMGGGRLAVVTGRDTYIKVASRDYSAEYEGIDSGVVCEGDEFKIVKRGGDVEVYHEMSLERGQILYGYCVAYRKGHKPVGVLRKWEDYRHLHSKSVWKQYGDDMIETRAICAALRRQFPLSGLYTEAEVPTNPDALQELEGEVVAEKTKSRLEALVAAEKEKRANGEGQEQADDGDGVPPGPSGPGSAPDGAAESASQPPSQQSGEGTPPAPDDSSPDPKEVVAELEESLDVDAETVTLVRKSIFGPDYRDGRSMSPARYEQLAEDLDSYKAMLLQELQTQPEETEHQEQEAETPVTQDDIQWE